MKQITKDEFLKLMLPLLEHRREFETFNSAFKLLLPDCYPVFSFSEKLVDGYLILVEDKIGNNAKDWIEWFIYENDCGKGELGAGFDDNFKPIKTVDDLYDVIFSNKAVL